MRDNCVYIVGNGLFTAFERQTMDYFDAYDEVFTTIEQFISEHGKLPSEVAVSPTLYSWLAEAQREQDFLHGNTSTDPMVFITANGTVHVVIDEALNPYQIIPQE